MSKSLKYFKINIHGADVWIDINKYANCILINKRRPGGEKTGTGVEHRTSFLPVSDQTYDELDTR